ncbi:putative late blight resistance protein homolog R1A-3 isoform X2 [Henckelia pumila]|uniref:putative late blight resistance protein homolog R1A-3 isoform X2 n=1 Tax=Henckelia pumila TaxID=405737 RepID=UPI003C6E6713
MATYGAVVPLMQDLRWLLSSFNRIYDFGEFLGLPEWKQGLQFLYENVCLMDSLLRLRDSTAEGFYDPDLIKRFESRITDVVHRAGSYIDRHTIDILEKLGANRHLDDMSSPFPEDFLSMTSKGLELMNEETACINEELQKISADRQSTQNFVEDDGSSIAGKSVTPLNTSHRSQMDGGKLVGLENDSVKMLGCLTGLPLKLQVFVVTGMAGIGKTTFARKLYEDPLVRHHFYVRVWVTISQHHRVKEVLLGLLSYITTLSDKMCECSHEQLRELVYQCLKGKRYLIILDDIWEEKDWNDLRMIFPDDKNGSRIIVTSRLIVAVNVSPDTPPHHMQHLSLGESWELLCSKVFVNQSCPQELIRIGKQIAWRCQGLPLAIVVVGGLLLKMDKTLKVWEEVEQSVGSLVMKDPQNCENILALSYDHLSDPLKACFLYMGVFPEDYGIPVLKLIWLWIAEGFILPVTGKTLEEVAEDYLEDLTARSLVMVKKRSNGRIKICYIHDLMRGLSLRISHKTFFQQRYFESYEEWLSDVAFDDVMIDFENPSSAIFGNTYFSKSLRFIRSCFCFETLIVKFWMATGFKLLRVLDIMSLHLQRPPQEIKCLFNLRYLALTIVELLGDLFSSNKLHNLQSLIVNSNWDGLLPLELWKMLDMRHFHIKSSGLPFSENSRPRIISRSRDEIPNLSKFSLLPNLLSLSTIRPESCSEKVFQSMPKLMKLGIFETEDDKEHRGWFKYLLWLPELESLKYTFSNPFVTRILRADRFPSCNVFPPKLLKLSLSGTSYPWEDMVKLSLLPKLEVLKLKNYAFSGPVWKSTEGGFRRLKFLQIGSTDLVRWESNGTHFPSLQHIVLRHCRSLTEIPHDIGEAPLLEKIELHCCGESAVKSARQIQEEHQNMGNDLLTVYITER